MNEEERRAQEQAAAVAEANAERTQQEVPAAEPEKPEVTPAPTQREQYMSAYGEDYPDLNQEDEEAFYKQANDNYSELKQHRQTRENLSKSLDKYPQLNDMIVLAGRGENPFAWLAENLGLDVREMADDPEFGKTLDEALAAYNKKIADDADAAQKDKEETDAYNEQVSENVKAAAQALAELQEEKGLSDEECEQVFNQFYTEAEQAAKYGIVSKEMWQAYLNARNYDTDMENARKEGATKALNEKFQNNVRKAPTDVPPSIPSGTGNGGSRRSGGFFSGVS